MGRHHEWADADFREIGGHIRERAGLVFSGARISWAEDAMRRTMTRLGLATPQDLRRRVVTTDDARNALLDELTIGESYFFREPRQLELVRRTVVSMAANPARAGRPLRLWSAGCAAGEEPHSLAILLREAHIAAGARVLGTDVAVGRLAAARRARYTRWALRGVSDERIARNFEQQGKHFVLDANVRQMVDYRALNLVRDDLASVSSDVGLMDVILCRNVLIYMDLPTVAVVATRLLEALDPDGWLFLGASDPPLSQLVSCEAVTTAEGTAYRRRAERHIARAVPFSVLPPELLPAPRDVPAVSWGVDVEQVSQPPRVVADRPADRMPETSAPDTPLVAVGNSAPARDAYRASNYESAATLARASIEARVARRRGAATTGPRVDDMLDKREDEADSITLVRALSNLGRIAQATEACAASVDRHRDSAELAYLYSVLLLHAGHNEAAATAARRALYIDRAFVLAHLALGDAFARSGEVARARRAFRNAITLLESAPVDADVPGADGESAARFLRVGVSQLNALDQKSAVALRTAP